MTPIPGENAKRREREIYQLSVYIAENPSVSASSVKLGAELVGPTCRSSLFYYLNEAISNGWINKSGNTRGTRYSPTAQFSHHLAMANLALPTAKRPKVAYRESFLGNYVPNETFYLSGTQRDLLHNSCGRGSFDAGDAKVAQEVRRFMADISHNSAAFEGVDVKLADTISFLEQNIESRNMSPNDAVILRNHYNAIRFIIENTRYPARAEDICISAYDTRNIHSYLSAGLLKDPRMQGRLRHSAVEIRDSAYIPSAIPAVIAGEFDILINKAQQIDDPYEQAIFLLVHIPYLQPFDDCNKRTSRLLCNIPLLRNGILPISWSEINLRDYTDSLMCIYEGNSTYGLCEVFVDACRRSFERFEISMKERTPSVMEVTHAPQIKEAVLRRILSDDNRLPADISKENLPEFVAIVEQTLADIRVNEFVAAPFGIRPAAVAEWMEREQQLATSTSAEAPA